MEGRDHKSLSFKPIGLSDLKRLLDLANADREDYFLRYPAWGKLYANRVLGVALCQGGALHFLDRSHGLNDFDVYTFYSAHPDRHWYPKRIKHVDFGDPKFGCSQVTNPDFIGRRVDLMGRELPFSVGNPLDASLRSYLADGKTRTARELARKAVIILDPVDLMGKVVWPYPIKHSRKGPPQCPK